ncbi:NAD(+) synthase [Flectobacillus roseus]|uniref:Glutamine-dependent NAD(+) synthetase n=1 Tax=Flectobacillus roseus TaxID=502259 RepID=A0ABT6Y592_9BACT|nr:NAD(+) synthase [Flectobacillus roseus]MDI9858734.1 NAD(+) synthase [Flectobacillus roseus]
MNLIKVAAGVVNQTPLAWESNKRNIIGCIEEAKSQDISILCLPELCITGYGCEDMFYASGTCETALEMLQDIVEVTSGLIVSVGLPILINNRVYNAACLISNKQIRGFACKKNLANNGLHYETRWFQPWPDNQRTELTIGEFSYPVGDLIFEAGGVKIGFEICEDAWIANRPGRSLYLQGVDIILNPTASHFAFFKTQTRERLVQDGSRAFGVAYIYANLLGNEAGRAIFDGDAMVAQAGEMLVSGTRFSYRDFYLTPAVIDLDKVRLEQVQNRLTFSGTSQKVPFLYDFPPIKPIKQRFELEHWEAKGFQKEEEFARAIALALFDYLRKSRSSGWVISLSGGADSSAITGLCYLAIELGVSELGLEGFKQKLGHIKKIQDCQSVQELSKALITNIYQGTENSSNDTRYSASSLAESLNTTFYDININGLVETYKDLIQGAIGRNLSWETDDLALQNIQARVRAPSAWLLANINNALLLATSNRSEAAVGYATMDGDTSGSISPIAGIDKHFLRHWLRWLEHTGLDGQVKLPGLNAMNNLQPTAELRPLEAKQIDEEDLMPYDLLNAIETAAFRDKKSPKDCLELMELEFEGIYNKEKLVMSIDRFFRLWSRNQWKRERYAPSFHVDDRNLDPRSWLRFPILSGGFEKELADMHDYANDSKGKQRRSRIGF